MQLFPDERDTILGAAATLRSGETTCTRLVERCLAQIDEWEPRVKAWVWIDREGAKAQATALDSEGAAGHWRGPLHGIPIGVKDIVDWAGRPTGAGSTARSTLIATSDATLLRKLRDAGAVLLGKTVTTQFASFDPPPTRNPWNLARTPGGSSSGSAAAVATGMCLAAIGSQTGGSITRPATYCGVAGCKPTYGRVSLAGVLPLAPSMDHPGPIARCVCDLAIVLNVIWGHDPADRNSVVGKDGSLDHVDLARRSTAVPRIGRLSAFEEEASPAMRAAFQTTIEALTAAGAPVAEANASRTLDELTYQHGVVMRYEAAHVHADAFRRDPSEFLPRISQLIEEGFALSGTAYKTAKAHQRQAMAEEEAMFAGCDAVVCPATVGGAPDAATTGIPTFNSPWSYLGLPTVSFPIGLDPEGLPLGIQLVGRRFAERDLFAAALWCERVVRRASGGA